MLRIDWMNGWTRRIEWLTMLAALLLVASRQCSRQFFRAGRGFTVSTSPTDWRRRVNVVLDSCGISTRSAIRRRGDEIPAGGGALRLSWRGGANYDIAPLSIDAAKANLYILQGTTGSLYKIPITNCVPQPASKVTVSNVVAILVRSVITGTVLPWRRIQRAMCSLEPTLRAVRRWTNWSRSTVRPLHDCTTCWWSHFAGQPITSIAVDSSNNIYYVPAVHSMSCPSPLRTTSTQPYMARPRLPMARDTRRWSV